MSKQENRFGELRSLMNQPLSRLDDAWGERTTALIDEVREADTLEFDQVWLPYLRDHRAHVAALVPHWIAAAIASRGKEKKKRIEQMLCMGEGLVLALPDLYRGPPGHLGYNEKVLQKKKAKLALALLDAVDWSSQEADQVMASLAFALMTEKAAAKLDVAHALAARVEDFLSLIEQEFHTLLRSSETEQTTLHLLDQLQRYLPDDAARVGILAPGVDHHAESVRERVGQLIAQVSEQAPESVWASCPFSDRIKRALIDFGCRVRAKPYDLRSSKITLDDAALYTGAWIAHYIDWPHDSFCRVFDTKKLYEFNLGTAVIDFHDEGTNSRGTPHAYMGIASVGPHWATTLGLDLAHEGSDPPIVHLEEDGSVQYEEFDRLTTMLSKLRKVA